MLSVTNKPFRLSVIMLSVVMLKVMARFQTGYLYQHFKRDRYKKIWITVETQNSSRIYL
jgi:hypothetical protein